MVLNKEVGRRKGEEERRKSVTFLEDCSPCHVGEEDPPHPSSGVYRLVFLGVNDR